MTILDVNVLIYSYNPDALEHPATITWLDKLFHSGEIIGLPWPTISAFLRVCTDRRMRRRATQGSPEDAFRRVRDWLAQPGVVLVHPGPRHLELLERLAVDNYAVGPLVSDAVLAALAIEHGATLASTDRDFSRFPNLRWVNPLS